MVWCPWQNTCVWEPRPCLPTQRDPLENSFLLFLKLWALRAYRSWLPGRGCSTRVHSRNPVQVLSNAQTLQLPHTKKWANLERSHLLKQVKNHPKVGLFSVTAEKPEWTFWPTQYIGGAGMGDCIWPQIIYLVLPCSSLSLRRAKWSGAQMPKA